MTDTFPMILWHNPACSTARKALEMIRAAGVEPELRLYLQTGWTADSLAALLSAAGMTARDALRRKDPRAADLGLLSPDTPDAAIFAAMLAHPVLVERPFVQSPRGTALCRPLDRLTALLP